MDFQYKLEMWLNVGKHATDLIKERGFIKQKSLLKIARIFIEATADWMLLWLHFYTAYNILALYVKIIKVMVL